MTTEILPENKRRSGKGSRAGVPTGRRVSLRFVRVGEGKLKSQDGRWTLWRTYKREGARPAHYCIYDKGVLADSGTHSQCLATARTRVEREAQANKVDSATCSP